MVIYNTSEYLESMTKEASPFPEFHLFPRLAKLGRFLTDQCHYQGLSDHFPHDTLATPPEPVKDWTE